MNGLRSVSEVKKMLMGLALAAAVSVGLSAYSGARQADCVAECGPCAVGAFGCDSCSAGPAPGGGCYAEGIGCDTIICDCGGDPEWGCEFYETEL